MAMGTTPGYWTDIFFEDGCVGNKTTLTFLLVMWRFSPVILGNHPSGANNDCGSAHHPKFTL